MRSRKPNKTRDRLAKRKLRLPDKKKPVTIRELQAKQDRAKRKRQLRAADADLKRLVGGW